MSQIAKKLKELTDKIGKLTDEELAELVRSNVSPEMAANYAQIERIISNLPNSLEENNEEDFISVDSDEFRDYVNDLEVLPDSPPKEDFSGTSDSDLNDLDFDSDEDPYGDDWYDSLDDYE